MRIKELDLIKLLAIIFMVIDHIRFLGVPDELSFILFCLGRLSFPLFCFLLASYFFRTTSTNFDSDIRYFRNLFIFVLISEIPYRAYGGLEFHHINIMLTLLFSFILLYSYVRPVAIKFFSPPIVAIAIVLLILLLERTTYFKVQYGILGVILPLSMYWVLKNKSIKNCLILATCAIVMNIYLYENIGFLSNFFLNIAPALISFFAAVFPFFLMKNGIRFNVPAVTKWAYWFYPTHFLILILISNFF